MNKEILAMWYAEEFRGALVLATMRACSALRKIQRFEAEEGRPGRYNPRLELASAMVASLYLDDKRVDRDSFERMIADGDGDGDGDGQDWLATISWLARDARLYSLEEAADDARGRCPACGHWLWSPHGGMELRHMWAECLFEGRTTILPAWHGRLDAERVRPGTDLTIDTERRWAPIEIETVQFP